MKIFSRLLSAVLPLSLLTAALAGCGGPAVPDGEAYPGFASYRDVPGITETEMEEIGALRERAGAFVYGMPVSTEAFENEDGEIRGYAALLCAWMTDFFEIPFRPALYEWADLLDGLETREIAFSGELTATEERRGVYYMTDAIASRPLKYFRLAHSRPLAEIAGERLLRCGFIEGTATIGTVVDELEPGTFEIVLLGDVSLVYSALKSGEIDAFYYSGTAEANFIGYSDLVAADFYPLIYRPVSLATRDPALRPVISVMDKVLRSGGMRHFTTLYNEGEQQYLRHKLHEQLTEEERAYIKNRPVIPMGVDPGNYPGCFYDRREKEWNGIFLDMLDEISSYTGLTFERVNDESATWPEICQMLLNGEVALVPELTQTRERAGQFLWPDTVEMIDYYALISNSDTRDFKINEVWHARVGVAKATAYATVFEKWFPGHTDAVEYESVEGAFDALRRGEVDMVMANQKRLQHLTHYLELPDYKANIVFDQPINTKLGFNKDEAVLCSIVDKTLRVIDTEGIANHWMRKTYDYRTKLVEAQRPWLIGASVLLLSVLALILVLFRRKQQEGGRLEAQVKARTNELAARTNELAAMEEEARAASRSKSAFLANMSHELRTPLNAIIGLTDLTLEEEGLSEQITANLTNINSAGGTLLSIVNDILDISKIESGKLALVPVNYHAASLLNDTVILIKTYIGEKPIAFRLEIGEDFPAMLYGDEIRVKQIMNNLLSNAVKYTKEGEVTLRVSSERDGPGIWMEITVTDTGMGIRESDIKNLFSEYYQTDRAANRKTEGTGLGLSITRRMAEMMDGGVTVKSEYGKGSAFTVRLRQGYIDDAVIGAAVAENLRGFSYSDIKRLHVHQLVRVDLSSARVLVVDDIQNNLDVAAGLMRKYQMKVDGVDSGQAAIDRIRGGKPVYNAIFMDHMMPGMDGIEAVRRIRALDTGYARNIPIIALTANAVSGMDQMFLENGFQEFLSKPIDLMELDAVLKKWVRDAAEGPLGEAPESGIPPKPEQAAVIEIPGVDAKAALARYRGDEEIYLHILRSYAASTPKLLDKLRKITAETLGDCTINAHGLKGSSANIGAEGIRAAAYELESASRGGDLETSARLAGPLIAGAETLVFDINAWLAVYDGQNQSERKSAPDPGVLAKLRESCEAYDMSGIDAAMDELEAAAYDAGGDLVAWLREKVDVMELDEVLERLSNL